MPGEKLLVPPLRIDALLQVRPHPLSLAAQSDAKVELLIDVHTGARGRATWSEQLYGHVESLQARAVQLTRSELGDVIDYPPALEVSMRGPSP